MTKNYKHIILLIWCSLLWATPTMASFENLSHSNNELSSISKDSLTTKKSDTTKTQQIAVESPLMARWKKEKILKIAAPEVVTDKKLKSFPELDKYIKNLYIPPNGGKAEFSPEYVKSLFKVDNKTQKVLDAGQEVFSIIEQNQRFIDIISGQEVIELPVGIKQNISDNSSITLGIVSMEYHTNYTVVDMFAKVYLAELNAELFFGANDVKISREGGIYEEARLNLLADFPVGQNGGQWLITFKGGMNSSGKADTETYITINCEGKVKEMALNADVRIAKTVAVPLNDDGSLKYPNKTEPGTGENPAGNDSYVGANFSIKAAGLEDLLIKVDLPYFELKALPNWGFKLDKTVLDLSDTKNAEGIEFPDLYRTQGLLQGNDNLWRGFHANEVKVTLPPEFKKKGSEKRISIGAKNLFIDNFGVSGDFYATNVLDINEGDASKWQFSVDSIAVDLKVNRFIKAGFKGEIVLPISENDETGKGQLGYTAIISADQNYTATVTIDDDIDFSIFKATAKLQTGSYINLEVENNKFYPEANLNGLMAFNAKHEDQMNASESEDGVELEFEGLSFENLKIQTKQRPYLSIGRAGFKDDIKLPKLAGFELGFHDVKITTDENDNAILGLNCFVNLDDSGISGDVGLNITGELQEGNLLKWRYKGIDVTDIEVDVKRKSFEFYGKLVFFKENPIYGKGFSGEVQLYAEDLGIEVGARGLFGAVDGYRYWFVDGHGRPTKNNNKSLTIYDIGGGVYHHMRKAGMDETATSLSGIKYQPDIDTELGFKALGAFEVKKGATFTALAGIEIAFNSKSAGGGVSRLGFYGAAILMKGKNEGGDPQFPMGSVDDMQKTVTSKEQSLSNFHELSIDKEGITYFMNNVFPTLLTGDELFACQIGLDLDFKNKSYFASLDAYINAGGSIKGGGSLTFYTSPTDWYIWFGHTNPARRLRFENIPIGPIDATIEAYFLTGTELPEAPQPPQDVIDVLHLQGEELAFGRNFNSELAQGVGFAFGASFKLGKEFDWGMVYASIYAKAGFDLMVRDFGDAHCKGREGPIGMDGWYSTGQMYALLQGEIGIKIKIFGIKKDVPVLEAGVAVLAQAQLPNPWFVVGYAGVDIKVLGIINIHTRLKVIFGEECEIIGKTGLQELVMISDITPRDGLNDVDVFDAIQVAFNVPVGNEVYIEDDLGKKAYRVKLKDLIVDVDGVPIEGEHTFNDQKDVLTFNSHEILPPEQKINVLAKVAFEEKIGSNWVIVTDEGKPVYEEKSVTFTTGDAPRKIPLKNIEYMYPIVNQQYMLPKESTVGYVQLDKGQEYLFGNGLSDELYFIDEQGNKIKTNFSYEGSEKKLNFTIPDLDNKTKYTYALITLNPGDIEEEDVMTAIEFKKISEDLEISNNTIVGSSSNSNAFISRLNFSFKTSKYDTFKKKMQSLKINQSNTSSDKFVDTDQHIANVGRMTLVLDTYEPFGTYDIDGGLYTQNKPLIQYEALLTDKYYKEDINPLIYKEYPLDKDIRINRDTTELGVPPIKSIRLSTAYSNYAKVNPDNTYLTKHFPYSWNLPIVYYYDYKDLQYQITNRYMKNGISNQAKYEKYEYLIWGRFPFLRREKYTAQFKYILPSKTSGSSQTIKYENTF
ncbi:hypothetical protein [Zobellia barbeyronii]|uniref:Uncharacterized protein n=1 Tax=Zobellia barbeyronii TaxID=2748009 RepID=A0ABS5WB34_9FLAO|nr:hypothetical protein [Zobellia barbeyronii]MBT2160030.1 hypothetical protein [Zobellia barbeyronii]